jgi:hypothetical protein
MDALPLIDGQLSAARSSTSTDQAFALARPHQLFLTGDQIYADDLAGAWLTMCIDVGGWLVGSRTEPVPAFAGPDPDNPSQGLPWSFLLEGKAPGPSWPLDPAVWPVLDGAGQPWKGGVFPTVEVRALPALRAGLTADSPSSQRITHIASELDRRKTAKMIGKNHAMLFGEFCAEYLLSWSPVLWCPGDPSGPQPVLPSMPPPPWDDEALAVAGFGFGVKAVRRALANIATYMVCDDHEYTDDTFMNRMWCERVFGVDDDTLGRRVIRNGLIAYAVFESWGNVPERFGPGTSGETLLNLLDQGQHMTIPPGPHTEDQVGLLVGMPGPLRKTDQRLTRDPRALIWYFRWAPAGWPYEVIFLDCRTARRYGPGMIDPPQLLDDRTQSGGATGPFSDEFAAQIGTTRAPANVVTLVVVQTPLLGVRPIEEDVQDIRNTYVAFQTDAEAWSISPNGFQLMLARLANRNPMTILLSGDVHYSFVAVADYFATRPWGETAARQLSARIVQLNSSGLKNEAFKTRFLQTAAPALFQPPIDRNPRTFLGFGTPQKVVVQMPPDPVMGVTSQVAVNETPLAIPLDEWGTKYLSATGGPLPQSDWMYRIEFLTGVKVPANVTDRGTPINSVPPGLPARVALVSPWLKVAGAVYRATVGTLIVGVNNLATVTFTGTGPTDWRVRQQVGWRALDVAHITTPLATTTYEVGLQIGPAPQVPGGA